MHVTGDPKAFNHLEYVSFLLEEENKESTIIACGDVKIPCRIANGAVELRFQGVVYLPQFYPGVISAPNLKSSGYTFERTLQGIKFWSGDTIVTAPMHPAGLFLIDTVPPAHKNITCMPFRQILLAGTMLLLLAVHSAPLYSETQPRIFMAIVLVTRLLIFLPLLLGYATPSSAFIGLQSSPSRAQHAAHDSYIVLFFSQTVEAIGKASLGRQGSTYSLFSVLKTIHDDPSISALGYDLLLAWLSVFIWYMEDFTIQDAVATGIRAISQAIQVMQNSAP